MFYEEAQVILYTRTRLYTDDYTLELVDLEPFWSHRMSSVDDKTFLLPSGTQTLDGRGACFAKINTGKVTIQAQGSNKVYDSSPGGAIYNNTNEKEVCVGLRYCHEITTWLVIGVSGTWVTTALLPLNDYFAVATLGIFPDPLLTPTDAERAYFAGSYGLRDVL